MPRLAPVISTVLKAYMTYWFCVGFSSGGFARTIKHFRLNRLHQVRIVIRKGMHDSYSDAHAIVANDTD